VYLFRIIFVFFIIFFFFKLELMFLLVSLEIVFIVMVLLVVLLINSQWLGLVLLSVSACEGVLGITFLVSINIYSSGRLIK